MVAFGRRIGQKLQFLTDVFISSGPPTAGLHIRDPIYCPATEPITVKLECYGRIDDFLLDDEFRVKCPCGLDRFQDVDEISWRNTQRI